VQTIASIAGLITVIVVLAAALVLARLKVAGPNQAFIVTGRKGRAVTNPETGAISTDASGQKVVMGASVFVIPFVQRLGVLDLSSRQIAVSVGSAVSAQGIKCSLEGVAVVKVGGTEGAIRAAAQRFLNQQNEIDHFTQEVLAGSLRAIVGRLSVEEIIKDRAAFAREVAEEAESSLTNQGLVVDTFQLQDIQTEGSYLTDLGRPEAARAEKEAAIAEAIAHREAEQARLKAEEQVAIAERELSLRQASIQAETDAANAEADAAGPIAKANRDQEVISAQEKVAVNRANLKERELDVEIRKPADAQRYAVVQQAEASKTASILNAEASRSAAILSAEASRAASIAAAEAVAEENRLVGAGERQRRQELAKAVEIEGAADAAAILARGHAEAEAMSKKADAYEQYGAAALIDLLAQVLPAVVREASAPIGQIDKLTVVSTEGASSLVKTVAANVEQGAQLSSDLLGIDIKGLLARAADKSKSANPNPST